MISVVIPTYKNRGGLTNCIDSALAQTCDDELEIIVVDDNTPDSLSRAKTEELMHKYDDDSRVIYIKHPQNKNGAAARNTGINASRGEYIALLDDDDSFLPGKLQKQMEYMKVHPEADCVYCLAKRHGKLYGNDRSKGDCTKEMLMLETNIYTPCQMFRREALLNIKGYDESFGRHQDYDLLLRFFHAGYKIGCLPEILTEIGTNEGENIPSGKKMEEMKKHFFEKFMPYIDEIDGRERGFKNRVLAKHYAFVFLNHVKHHHCWMALKVICKYFFKAPSVFFGVLHRSLALRLNKVLCC